MDMIGPLSQVIYLPYFLALISPGFAAAATMRRRGWLESTADQLVCGYVLGYTYAILGCILFMRFDVPLLILAGGSAGVTGTYLMATGRKSGMHLSGLLTFLDEHKWELIFGLTAIALTVLVVMRAGRLDGGVHVFPTLFVNDYFNHLAVTAELARNVPPANIYYQGITAHYYWFFHVVPASFHRLVDLQASVRHLLLWQNCLNILMLFFALGQLLRHCGISRRAVAMTLSLVLFFYSYIDIFIIGRAVGNSVQITELIPPLASIWPKLENFSGLSHGYLRDFWVEPHAVAAILFSTVAVQMQCAKQSRMPQVIRGMILGALVFATFGCDSFLGTILALWVALDNGIDFVKGSHPQRRSLLYLTGGVATVAVVALGYIFGLNMIGGQKGLLLLTPMTGVLATLPFYLALDYGPIFLCGLAGWYLSIKERNPGYAGRVWLLGVVALVMGLFLRHAVEYDILLRKSGKPLQLVLLIGAGLLFERMGRTGRRWRIIMVIVLLMALPTIGFDLQAFGGFGGSRGMENYLDSKEMKALRWIKTNTPSNSIVQGQPGYQGEYVYEFNPIPPLAERSVAVGTYMMSALWGVGGKAALGRIHSIDSLFQAESAAEAAAIMKRFDIDYLYIGPRERRVYQLTADPLWADMALFETVYNHDSVTILRYRDESYENDR